MKSVELFTLSILYQYRNYVIFDLEMSRNGLGPLITDIYP